VKIEPRSHIPLYLQIADGLREAVAAGIYRAGEPLPSLRVLACDVHVNPNTVQRAYDTLAREGLIAARRGKGLFVTEEGVAAAKGTAQQMVRQLFDEAIRAGVAAGMSGGEIRRVAEAGLSTLEQRDEDG